MSMCVNNIPRTPLVLDIRGGFRGGHTRRAPPSIFCKDGASDFVWAPPGKKNAFERMTLKITIFSTSEGAHPPQTPPFPQAMKLSQSLIWVPALLKNPGSALGYTFVTRTLPPSRNVQTKFLYITSADVINVCKMFSNIQPLCYCIHSCSYRGTGDIYVINMTPCFVHKFVILFWVIRLDPDVQWFWGCGE